MVQSIGTTLPFLFFWPGLCRLDSAGYYMTFEFSGVAAWPCTVFTSRKPGLALSMASRSRITPQSASGPLTPFEYAAQDYQPPIAMLPDITGYLNRQRGPDRMS